VCLFFLPRIGLTFCARIAEKALVRPRNEKKGNRIKDTSIIDGNTPLVERLTPAVISGYSAVCLHPAKKAAY
jgi:hypothetical protein